MELSIAEIEKISGFSYKTIKKRLENLAPIRRKGNSIFYESRDAIPLLFKAESEGRLNLDQERAKLAKAQTEKVELESSKLKGTLVDANELAEAFKKEIIAAKAKLLRIPKTLGAQYPTIESSLHLEDFATDLIHESLAEIASAKD